MCVNILFTMYNYDTVCVCVCKPQKQLQRDDGHRLGPANHPTALYILNIGKVLQIMSGYLEVSEVVQRIISLKTFFNSA